MKCLKLLNDVAYKLCSLSVIITVILIKENEVIGTHSTHGRRKLPKSTLTASRRSTDRPRYS